VKAGVGGEPVLCGCWVHALGLLVEGEEGKGSRRKREQRENVGFGACGGELGKMKEVMAGCVAS